MRLRRISSGQSGLTIMEVLVGAVVFMIGFSVLVSVLNSTLLKLSIEELELAGAVAETNMIYALSECDTTSQTTIETNGDLKFRVAREVRVQGHLVSVSIRAYRLNRDKELIHLYDEFTLPKK